MPALTFQQLADENRRLWAACEIRSDRVGDIHAAAERIARNRDRYETIGGALNMPWYFVGFLHLRESNCNFGCHLHNGDPLSGKTYHVPAGRPLGPPRNGQRYTFEESAQDALRMMGLDKIGDWPVERQMYEAERYNGFGYRGRSGRSPYVFGGTNEQCPGKYIADGRYDPTHWDVQPGFCGVLKALLEKDPHLLGIEPATAEAMAAPKAGFEIPAADGGNPLSGSRKMATANAGQVASAAGAVGLGGISIADGLGYANSAAAFLKTYGVELAIGFLVIAAIGFAAFRHFTQQDYAEGRYVPRDK